MRKFIVKNLGEKNSNWTFADSVTAWRFFRIDRAQEGIHYVADICNEEKLFIVFDQEEEEEGETLAKCVESVESVEVSFMWAGLRWSATIGRLKMLDLQLVFDHFMVGPNSASSPSARAV